MQQLLKFCTLALLVFFVSCNKDDDASGGDDLIRTWKVTEVNCTDGKTVVQDGTDITTTTFTFTGKDITSEVIFKDDKTFSSTGSYTQVLKTTFQGTTFTNEITFSAFATSGTWTKDGNNLTLKNASDPAQTAEITELTSSKLRFKVFINESETDPVDGVIVKNTATVSYVLVPK